MGHIGGPVPPQVSKRDVQIKFLMMMPCSAGVAQIWLLNASNDTRLPQQIYSLATVIIVTEVQWLLLFDFFW